MNGLDCLVFTAGIGENTSLVREAVCTDMEYFGIKLDKERNLQKNDGTIHEISAPDSKVKVLVIPTNEELVIARETRNCWKADIFVIPAKSEGKKVDKKTEIRYTFTVKDEI